MMQGRLDRDETESKKCNAYQYGKKFKSFRLGYRAGKQDGRRTELVKREKNPYPIPEAVWELLKKRARWETGYAMGWETGRKKKRKRRT